MKQLVFDSGPIISLTTNSLLWLLPKLKIHFEGEFLIPVGVKEEIVDHPLRSKKFKFEALQVMRCIREKTLVVVDAEPVRRLAAELASAANSSFLAKGRPLSILQEGELETLALALHRGADAVVIDERTTRILVEDQEQLLRILGHRFNTRIEMNREALQRFRQLTKSIRILRSVELVAIAFELGLLDEYLAPIPHSKRILVESLLWGVKLQGCAVSEKEIIQLTKQLI